jgi:hypothetical protein
MMAKPVVQPGAPTAPADPAKKKGTLH